MGTINYKTSDYITLAFKDYNYFDFERDAELLAEHDEYAPDMPLHEYILQTIADYEEEDYSNIEYNLNEHAFYYYHVTLEPGYYEGSQLLIESNFPCAFNSWEDKREAQKELTELKAFLIECAGLGMVKTSPGWGTGYKNYPETIQAITETIKEMREEVRNTPTWTTYERG